MTTPPAAPRRWRSDPFGEAHGIDTPVVDLLGAWMAVRDTPGDGPRLVRRAGIPGRRAVRGLASAPAHLRPDRIEVEVPALLHLEAVFDVHAMARNTPDTAQEGPSTETLEQLRALGDAIESVLLAFHAEMVRYEHLWCEVDTRAHDLPAQAREVDPAQSHDAVADLPVACVRQALWGISEPAIGTQFTEAQHDRWAAFQRHHHTGFGTPGAFEAAVAAVFGLTAVLHLAPEPLEALPEPTRLGLPSGRAALGTAICGTRLTAPRWRHTLWLVDLDRADLARIRGEEAAWRRRLHLIGRHTLPLHVPPVGLQPFAPDLRYRLREVALTPALGAAPTLGVGAMLGGPPEPP